MTLALSLSLSARSSVIFVTSGAGVFPDQGVLTVTQLVIKVIAFSNSLNLVFSPVLSLKVIVGFT